MNSLWTPNRSARFRLCHDEIAEEGRQMAIRRPFATVGVTIEPLDVADLLALVLDEDQFGPGYWRLGMPRYCYYARKRVMPLRRRGVPTPLRHRRQRL